MRPGPLARRAATKYRTRGPGAVAPRSPFTKCEGLTSFSWMPRNTSSDAMTPMQSRPPASIVSTSVRSSTTIRVSCSRHHCFSKLQTASAANYASEAPYYGYIFDFFYIDGNMMGSLLSTNLDDVTCWTSPSRRTPSCHTISKTCKSFPVRSLPITMLCYGKCRSQFQEVFYREDELYTIRSWRAGPAHALCSGA